MQKSVLMSTTLQLQLEEGLKKEFHSTNNVEHNFWLRPYNIKRCASESIKKYALDQSTIPNNWLV